MKQKRGSNCILEISLGIFKLVEARVLRISSEQNISIFLNDFCANCYDDTIFEFVGTLDNNYLLGLRSNIQKDVETRLSKLDEMRDIIYLSKFTLCKIFLFFLFFFYFFFIFLLFLFFFVFYFLLYYFYYFFGFSSTRRPKKTS